MAKYTHIPRVHPALKFPPDWTRAGFGGDAFGFIGSFTKECLYEISSPKIDGFNKFGGVSWGIDATDKAALCGWMPDQDDAGYFRLAFYWHNGDGEFYFDSQEGMLVVPGEEFAWWAVPNYAEDTVKMWFQAERTRARFSHEIEIPDLGHFHRDVHPWFGDDGTAPHRMSFYKDRVWRWENGIPYNVKNWRL